jgi:L-alanine-DL-glutamate epimerase-like enolase superfamily enzyme
MINSSSSYPRKGRHHENPAIPISSPIRNAYIDFSKMTLSLVAVITDVIRDGKPVVGYGFNSNGRYGQGKLMRERFIPRILEADPESLVDDKGTTSIRTRSGTRMFKNEKPGGHGERSVAIGTIDMAVWDAVAKIEGKPLFQLLADRYGDGKPNRKVFVYAAGGYYYPGQDHEKLKDEMRSYIDRGYTVVKMKIGGASLDEDLRRIDSVLSVLQDGQKPGAWTPTAASTWTPPSPTPRRCRSTTCSGTRKPATRSTSSCRPPAQLLQEPDGHRREPVLDAGRAQPDPLRRHARRPRLAAVRLRAVVRPGRIPAHAGHAAAARLVASRCIPHGGHQMSLNIAAGLGLGGNESYPDLFQPFGGFPDGVKVENSYVTMPDLPGIGFEARPTCTARCGAGVASYAQKAQHQGGALDFIMNIVPNSVVGAFANGDMLPIIFFSLLLAIALARLGKPVEPFVDMLDMFLQGMFGVVRLAMFVAPLGAFGGMAFTVGKYGIGTLASYGELILCLYLTLGRVHRAGAGRRDAPVRPVAVPVPPLHQG